MQPINYNLDTPPPAEAFTAGLGAGSALRGAAVQDQAQGFALQQQQAAIAAQQQAVQLAAQQRADLAALAANPNPTAKDYAGIVFKYPALKDSMKQGWDALSADKQSAKLANATPVFAALQAGRVDLARDLMTQQLAALKNSGGDPKEIQATDTWLKMLDMNPDVAKHSAGIMLASAMGPEKFESMFGKAGSEARANANLPSEIAARDAATGASVAATAKTAAETAALPMTTAANLANIQSQITTRAAQLNLDADKLMSETQVKLQEIGQKYGKIEPDARKIVNDSATAAVLARNTAQQMTGLADQFDRADIVAGLRGSMSEKFKELSGQQDYFTQLRREYTRIRNADVQKNLPPGAASDKDIAIAQSGFIKETADPKEIASFLRGMAKLQDYQAKLDDTRAEWAGAVGHLGKTNKDIEIGGVKVPAGYTLSDFLKKTLAAPGPSTTAPKPGGGTGYLDKYGGGASGSY